MKRINWATVLGVPYATLLLMVLFAGRAQAASIAGVYALGMPGRPMPPEVLNDSNVDGLALRFPWDLLEPEDGRFDWGPLDHEFEAAAEHRKVVSLIILPGVRTPGWVYAAGAQSLTFQSCESRFGGPTGSGARIPLPWDPVFLAKWQGFLRALGARYGNRPQFVLMKTTGVNAVSGELAMARGGGCLNTDLAGWQRAGYTRAKIKGAFTTLLDTYAAAFPNQKLALMLVPRPLPPIDERGGVISGQQGDIQGGQEIIDIGISRLGPRFVVQNNGLSSFWSWERIPQLRDRVAVGYQMLWNASGDPRCRMNRGEAPCDPRPVLQNAVNRGIETGASYLEIYVQDILNPNLQGVIADAHRRLTGRSESSSVREY